MFPGLSILIYDEKYIDYHNNNSNLSQCPTHSKYSIHILLNKWINKCRRNSPDNGKEIWKQQEIIMGHYWGGRAALISGHNMAGRQGMRQEGRMGREIKGLEFRLCSKGSGEPFVALSQHSDQICGLESSLCQKNKEWINRSQIFWSGWRKRLDFGRSNRR